MSGQSSGTPWGAPMKTRILAGLFLLVALVAVPAAPAVAADALVVQIRASQVTLNADGTVSVALRVRCSPQLDAFEVGVGVRQDTTFGGVSVLGGAFPACTGKWQRTTLTVTAESGTFVSGTATVTAYVAAYDTVEDHDVFVEDTAIVRL
jgi:hypothetical protein